MEGGLCKELEERSCFRFRRGAIYMVTLKENICCYDMTGRRREVVVSKVKASRAWR